MIVKQLNNSVLLYFAVIILALGFQWFTAKNYKLSKNQVLTEITGKETKITFFELKHIFSEGRERDYLFVDIRSIEEYEINHINNALNIPLENIMQKRSRSLLSLEKPKIIVASTEAEAHFAQFLMVGIGIDNVFVLQGGFNKAFEYVIKEFKPAYGFYSEDKAKYDFPRFMNVAGESTKDAESIVPDIETLEITIEGGC